MNKIKIEDLALFGGDKCFSEPYHVGRPNLGDRQRLLTRLNDILDNRWLSNHGPYVQAFEKQIACIANTKHAIACCNGTVALEIAIRALNLTGEVIVPSFTFIATAHALQWQEITPVFADISAKDHNLNPCEIQRNISAKTTGILGVHLWGQACDTERIDSIARKNNLKVLYDGSHAFGCDAQDGPIGGQGAATIFSFHATKFINSLEGGAIVTNDDHLASKMRLMSNFGFRTYDDVIHIGTNGKLNEFSAAMGLTNLEAMKEIVEINKRNYFCYKQVLDEVPGIRLINYNPVGAFNYQYVVAEVDDDCSISRDNLVKILWEENFLVRRYFWPGCHKMQPYASYSSSSELSLQVTEQIAKKILVLPTGETVGEQTIEEFGQLLKFIVSNGSEIEHRISPARKIAA